jgi:FkbM family methyltransferase
LHGELSQALQRRQIYPEEIASDRAVINTDVSKRAVSQLGQDLWVLEQTGQQRGGYFVEFGATDGVMLNNTLLLEREFGWTGLCSEPNPKFFRQLAANRRCKVLPDCIGSVTGEKVRFILADVYGGMEVHAGIDSHKDKRDAYLAQGEVIDLTTISLDDFLMANNAPRSIDYLSIDTEGSEFDILNAFPFDRWTIRFITVEHNFTPLREKIYTLLTSFGYHRTEAKWDDWYALKA